MKKTKAWVEKITIPTYPVGEPDNKPHFLEKRVYQGSSGVTYPYPIIDKIYDEKIAKEYIGIFLENKYIKILILPELGGRIQTAYDKIAKRDFIYRNNVIKPALVGLTGPWISGGIEFNWPQHHRPTTFSPVDYNIVESEDSSTVWVGETEKMFGLRGIAGFTLHKNKSYIEISVKIYNGTNLPQTFLWWANPAVKASGGHQSIFPPDVNAVFDHGKRDVSSFPLARGTYYKADYSAGVDISKYDNISVPTSYMAYKSKYDFVGAYVHDEDGGLLHIANHNISPGKKQWTWGNGDFGQAWDKNLTDEDGPYIELMTGVFTDNQPDFTWLEPYEEKIFTQYFMPYNKLGTIKNANKDIVLKADLIGSSQELQLGVYATSNLDNLSIKVYFNKVKYFEKSISVSPENIFLELINIHHYDFSDVKILIYDSKNKLILSWKNEDLSNEEIPEPAKAPVKPKDVKYSDELIFIGQHIEQYRHATADAEKYYLEATTRDKLDSRANLCLARLNFRRGNFELAENYINNSLKRSTNYNSNPYDGEVFFLKGLILEYLNKESEAFEYYYKATWNGSYADKGFFSLARLSIKKKDYLQADYFITNSLQLNGKNHKAKLLNVIIKRLLKNTTKAKKLIEEYTNSDFLELSILFEKYLMTKDDSDKNIFLKLSRCSEVTFLDIARSYIGIGAYNNTIILLELLNQVTDPMIYYYLAYCYYKLNSDVSNIFISLAENMENKGIFPNHIDDITILNTIISINKDHGNAEYLLANLFYDKKQYNVAIRLWENSLKSREHSITYRNLAVAYYNKKNLVDRAKKYLEKAVSIEPNDARLIFELNDLYCKIGLPMEKRKEFLNKNKEQINKRDDLLIEWIRIHNLTKDYSFAQELIRTNKFHPWEGGEGKITGEYVINLQALAIECMNNKNYNQAVKLLKSALIYPENLGEGKLPNNTTNDTYYLLYIAYKYLNNDDKIHHALIKSSYISDDLSDSIYYNDTPADYIFYTGMAQKSRGNKKEAQNYFNKLIKYAANNINNNVEFDFFAVSLPDFIIFDNNLNIKNKVFCNFLYALGYFGLEEYEKANKYLAKTLKLDINHNKANHFKNIVFKFLKNN